MKISILMLTHNAPKYVKKTIITLKKNTTKFDYELVVVDNASEKKTKNLLTKLKQNGYIDKLIFNKNNELYARGNNIAARNADSDSDYYLLMNSDVKIKSKTWLEKLTQIQPKEGISSLGAVLSEPIRADGYCMLINKPLYDKYLLDESFEWWWALTKLQAEVLREGKVVRAIANHEKYIHHYGGKSGKGFKDAKGMDVSQEEIKSWFDSGKVEIIDRI